MRTAWLAWLDRFPLTLLIVGALLLGLSPFMPEPHLWEKLKMLAGGTLVRPIDIFDLLLHASLPVLLALRLVRQWDLRRTSR
ncbi:MAG: RND transporter [Gammaproteobacteria bacterium]|nr:RND transporter [Gammaproteobacteria bacterium]